MEKMRYRRFCKQAWSDAKLVEEIKKKFLTVEQRQQLSMITDEKERRNKVLIVFGNWSRSTQMKGCAPSPGKGLRRMRARHFRILTIWEGYTSQLYHRTHQRLSTVYKPDPSDPTSFIKIHEVLTLPGDPHQHRIFVNRDVNASRNIHFLTMCWLHSQTSPIGFSRPT
jgi:hypothetical protein